jgi:hypothetical protein
MATSREIYIKTLRDVQRYPWLRDASKTIRKGRILQAAKLKDDDPDLLDLHDVFINTLQDTVTECLENMGIGKN